MENQHLKRCFVISPIGQEGTTIRAHADDVFDFIIKPAMDECGVSAWRSDHLHEPGKISEQMFRALLTDDLCVALLTGYNPNVFYELAIAQCAARPVIMLAEKGQELPFDIRDLRCVYYDLNPRPLFDKVYVKQIVSHIRSIEAAQWKGSSPIGEFNPLAVNAEPPVKVFDKSMNYGNAETWLKLLQETEERFDIMAITPDKLRGIRRGGEVLLQKAAVGCRIRVLLIHEDNPALPQFINHNILNKNYETMLFNVRDSFEYFTKLAQETPNIEIRRIKTGCPHFRLTLTERVALLTPYLFSEKADYSPLFECAQGSPLYNSAAQEFEVMWGVNK